jgi:hypothetical protein
LDIVAVPLAPDSAVVNAVKVDPSSEPSNCPVWVLNLMVPGSTVDLSAVVPDGKIKPSVVSIFLIWFTPFTPVYLPPDM